MEPYGLLLDLKSVVLDILSQMNPGHCSVINFILLLWELDRWFVGLWCSAILLLFQDIHMPYIYHDNCVFWVDRGSSSYVEYNLSFWSLCAKNFLFGFCCPISNPKKTAGCFWFRYSIY